MTPNLGEVFILYLIKLFISIVPISVYAL